MSQFVRLPASSASISGTVDVNLEQVGGASIAIGQAAMAASLPVVIASDQSAVPVSAASLPLPSGAATEATLSAMSAKLPAALGAQLTAASMSVNIASDQTVPISAASLPLPSGAATAAKQPALGTAGSASADVISVQGIASMTPLSSNLYVGGSVASTANPVPIQPPASGYLTVNIGNYGGTATTLGQKAMSASMPVVLASDQSSIPVAATLQAGSDIVGKVGIDQTTIGTTNGISVVPSSTSTAANSSLASTALEASHVIKASAGRLYQLTGVNTKSSGQYIQVFNSTTVPADATAPVLLCYVPANANFSFDFGPIGRYFSTGIAVSNSSTAATKTVGSADCWFNAEYL